MPEKDASMKDLCRTSINVDALRECALERKM